MINFERGSTATYVNKQGVLAVVQANEPRFEEKGILIEGTSTNVSEPSAVLTGFTEGETFDFGELKMKQYTATVDGVTGYVRNLLFVNTTPAKIYTCSYYIKPIDGFDDLNLCIHHSVGGNNLRLYYKVSTGVLTKPVDPLFIDGGCEVLGDGVFRLWITFKNKVATPNPLMFWSEGVKTGDSFYIGGWQTEELEFATSYIPTSVTAVTRDADRLYVKDTDFFKGEASISFDFDTFKPSGNALAFGIDSGYNYLGNEGDFFQSRLPTLVVHPRVGVNKYTKVTAVRSSSSFGVYLNGVYVETKATELPNLAATFCIGGRSRDLGGTVLWGHVKGFKIWEVALTPEQVSTL